ncbi:MAG: hypothetical protein JXB47_10050 [Anaerolineae bacterium]|nr:hypothetical protein [Anaerolineae bacterium]
MSNPPTQTTVKSKQPPRDRLPVMETFPNTTNAWSLDWDHGVIVQNDAPTGRALNDVVLPKKTYKQ